MFGKVKVESVSYRQFCNRVRKLYGGLDRPTDDQLYDEWNKCLNREGNIDYAWHAANLRKKAQP
jgi:hypothetical protein